MEMDFNNINYYAIIPANVRYDKDISASAKLLYGEITSLCNQKGFCWATNEYFANLYDVSKETISRWISSLNKKGYLKIKIFYKKNSKEIDKRIMSISNENLNQYPIDKIVNTYPQNNQSIDVLTKTSIPYPQNNQDPIDKNVKENNKNIINNNYIYSRVIDYLNEKVGTNYKSTTDKTKKLINARLNENFTEQDFYKVIDNKCATWLKDENMNKYLRPETLFSNKFESYLNESKINEKGISGKQIDKELEERFDMKASGIYE